jgi:hypothetical protein
MLDLKNVLSGVLLMVLTIPTASAQLTTPTPLPYPQDYFLNPLDLPILLAGNFGECRPGHFHSGVDIKTRGEENYQVHAAADGYVSRIKMEKGGFGHGLYITHPSGYTTLYAHLNDFSPELQRYVKAKQYEKKQWNVELQLEPGQFPVKKGQVVAFSGNTGASTAPHLHFEIRNSITEHPLNPALFGLPIKDSMAPVPLEIGIYSQPLYDPGTESKYPVIAGLRKMAGYYGLARTAASAAYVTGDTIMGFSGWNAIGINVNDYMNGSDNSLTFYTAELFADDSLQSKITLDDIGYDETRYINAYADYKTKKQRGRWLQCFAKVPGNHLDRIFTKLNKENGWLNAAAGQIRKIEIVLTDVSGNQARVKCYLKATRTLEGQDITGDNIYRPGVKQTFSDPNIHFTLDELQLYETIRFNFAKKAREGAYSDEYQLHYAYIPLHHYFDLKIKPTRPIPFDLRNKVILRYNDGNSEEGSRAAGTEGGWYTTSVRNFGNYWLAIDTLAPRIKTTVKEGANLAKAKQILFTATDAETSVKSFSGYLDDKWICFEQHGNSFFYKFDEHCSRGKHTLVFKAADENGNENAVTINFTR